MTLGDALRRADDEARPIERLRLMAQRRPVLLAPFQNAESRIVLLGQEALDAWAQAVIELAHANVGVYAQIVALRWAAETRPLAVERLVVGIEAAAALGRRAGAGAARAAIQARLDLDRRFSDLSAHEEALWWRGLRHLSQAAPECVEALASASGTVLSRCGAARFEAFVATGLRAAGPDRTQRLDFFRLSSPEAKRTLDLLSGAPTFAALRPRLHAFPIALWGRAIPLRPLPERGEDERPPRATISSGIVLLPETPLDVPARLSAQFHRAAVAHASAHLAFGATAFEPARLKPIQIVLAGLIEDARVETLAMRRFPGLRTLWGPFHTAPASHLKTASSLLARLARAMFDPAFVDDDGFVARGRALFQAEPDLHDHRLSRRIGDRLGNDFGQMRVQFNDRLHVVEPAYRDDNIGLWSFPEPDDGVLHRIESTVQSARVVSKPDDPDGAQSEAPEENAEAKAGRGRPVPPDERGTVLARYPEWDPAAGIERPEWTTVWDAPTPAGDGSALEEALEREAVLRSRIARLVGNATVGLPRRLKRQPEGLELDLDAIVEAVARLRSGEVPDDNLYMRKVVRTRDLAVLLLVDVSESTRDLVEAAGTPVIAIEKIAVAMLAEAMRRHGDRFALRAFASDGRHNVRMHRIKDFDRPYDAEARDRLAALRPGLSTRLGAALRHAGAELRPVAATRRIVITLTDGAPADIDVTDPADLVADARRAVLGLHASGIDVFGMTLDAGEHGAGATIFGRTNHLAVRRIEELPRRLAELYFRVARR